MDKIIEMDLEQSPELELIIHTQDGAITIYINSNNPDIIAFNPTEEYIGPTIMVPRKPKSAVSKL